jgi:hypothetical protein
MDSITFDRDRPLYRLFDMGTEDGIQTWFTVEADNTPGRELSEFEVSIVEGILTKAAWRDQFYEAFKANKKATIYAQKVESYSIPEGCDGLIRLANIREHHTGHKFAQGYIYGDRKGRWADGHPIYTSYILQGPDAEGMILTRNSTYKLELRAADQ